MVAEGVRLPGRSRPDWPACRPDNRKEPTMSFADRATNQPAGKTQWTCPMHPEVVRDEPGRCPTCRMFLVEVPQPKGN